MASAHSVRPALAANGTRGIRVVVDNLDRRRHIKQMGGADRAHPLDEGLVVTAMARQFEEIRNLPEVVH